MESFHILAIHFLLLLWLEDARNGVTPSFSSCTLRRSEPCEVQHAQVRQMGCDRLPVGWKLSHRISVQSELPELWQSFQLLDFVEARDVVAVQIQDGDVRKVKDRLIDLRELVIGQIQPLDLLWRINKQLFSNLRKALDALQVVMSQQESTVLVVRERPLLARRGVGRRRQGRQVLHVIHLEGRKVHRPQDPIRGDDATCGWKFNLV
eukprot:CAMPEP_0198225454 /NCGR_PEP_ID=MMETSP1445-20131203/101149_1 /TAXON_ID=36898 /ORGANISM="Pyramimonas sp., Strain CCMP2087" /LENGTH=206 /DNA_ID=CAMNT_0043904979 /DNA_START=137 /DNA_END=757 /DNA_ORIENTATION=-